MSNLDIGDRRDLGNANTRRLYDKIDKNAEAIADLKAIVTNGLSHRTEETSDRVERIEEKVNLMSNDLSAINAVMQQWGKEVIGKMDAVQENMLTKEEHEQIETNRHTVENIRHDAMERVHSEQYEALKGMLEGRQKLSAAKVAVYGTIGAALIGGGFSLAVALTTAVP